MEVRDRLQVLTQSDGVEAGGAQEPEAAKALGGEEFETVYVEGVDDIPEEQEPGPGADELAKQNADLQARIDALQKQVDPVQSLQQGLSALGDKLEQPRRTGENPSPPQQPGESEEDFAKRVRDNFYDDPYQTLQEFQNRKMQPLVAQMVNSNLAHSKRFLGVDPGKSETWKQYEGEIEEEIQGMNYQEKAFDPDIYSKAHDRVIARHMDEILEKKVEQRLAQAPAPAPSSEASTYRPTPGKGKAVKKLTRQEAAVADAKGIPYDYYYDWLVEHGRK